MYVWYTICVERIFMKVFIRVVLFVLFCLGIYVLFDYIKPVDATMNLYISCNNYSKKYDVFVGDKFDFGNESCFADFEILDINNNYIKLRSSKYFFKTKTDGGYDNHILSYDVYVPSDGNVVLIGSDKKTIFEFSFK